MWGEGLASLAAMASGWGIGGVWRCPGLTGVKMVLAGGSGLGAAHWGLGCIQV